MGEIYKITNNITGKIYIGQSKRSSYIRWLEHIRDARNYPDRNIPLHKAINKYGKDSFSLDVIESNIPNERLNDLEREYIKKYESNKSSIGYNATDGGEGGNTNSSLSVEEVNVIRNLLSDVTNGYSISKIAQMYEVPPSVISNINTGKSWNDSLIDYPIRRFSFSEIGIDRSLYANIVDELANGNLKLFEISKKYKISTCLVGEINQGRYCYDGNNPYYADVYCGKFPIRDIKQQHQIDVDFNKVFYEVLFTDKSIIKIEKEFGIPFNGLRYIVLGKRRKDVTEGYIKPLRNNLVYNRSVWIKKNKGATNEICTD